MARFLQPASREGVIGAVEDADSMHLPLCVLGGGSNLLASDDDFPGVVVRDARRAIAVRNEAAAGEATTLVGAEAGANWDDTVAFSVRMGLSGIEALSGIPGTAGAAVVQNIGAYGQEIASSVAGVQVWDRRDRRVRELSRQQMAFGYRSSLLRRSMREASGRPDPRYFPSPRYIVLSITLALRRSRRDAVTFGQLAHALGVPIGSVMSTEAIRAAVLRVRAGKAMLEDPNRYDSPWMRGMKAEVAVESARRAMLMRDDAQPADRHSCGSFFVNPIVAPAVADRLPADAPRFDARTPEGLPAVKTSAAWLIDHAGFHRGYALPDHPKVSLSTRHTLALTNRADARCSDVLALARVIRDGVAAAFGIRLIPEPVIINGIDSMEESAPSRPDEDENAAMLALSRRAGATDEDLAAARAFASQLDRHYAWGIAFHGYCNPAGYGYAFDPSFGVSADGWDAYHAFQKLSPAAQTVIVLRALEPGCDADRESARYFLKFERGIIVHDDQPF